MTVVVQPGASPSQSQSATSPQAGGGTVESLVTRVQALLNDPRGQWAKYDFLKSFINAANEDLNTELAAYNLSYGEVVIELSAVPAGTTDLASYMAEGGLLENLESPTSIEWKVPGEADTKYKVIKKVDAVLDAESTEYPKSWEWRGSVIYLSPFTQALDLRVRYDAMTVPLDDPSDTVLRGCLNVLAYKTAELVAGIRGGLAGTGEPLAKYMERKCETAKEDFESLMVKRDQSKRRRFGRALKTPNRGIMTIPVQ